ncbi:MAG TPA: DSD1 family PLP-dependent enzyme [Dehalococcoidia bacterium]|nr:DSD1 family PLP-dependent enzyme [Dehalococcoidia bacterium]
MAPNTLNDIPTPALLLDIAGMERNIRRMADFFAQSECKLRPHFKAHKTPEIARRQLAAGSCTGLTCATVGEAEIASEFCDDILIANQVIGRDKVSRVAQIARRGIDIKIAVDSIEGLDQIARAAEGAEAEVGLLVDVNVGMPRCGVQPGEPAAALAKRISDTANVRLRGAMGYEGHVVGIPDRTKRAPAAATAMSALSASVQAIRDAGLPCEIVSAGGTGTYDITGRIPGITEIQAGSYVLMDTAYGKLDIPFEQAMWVLGTVVSRPSPLLCVLDSGHKSCTEDHGNPSVRGIEGASVMFLSDEHASLNIPADSQLKAGDRVQLVPSHIDPTINLHDVFYALDGEKVAGVWPIAARGYPEQRGA